MKFDTLAMIAGLVGSLVPVTAWAVPGPDSVAVVANAAEQRSVDLARRYARARGVPDRQVCLVRTATTSDVDLDRFRREVLDPVEVCLTDGAVLDRIEAMVVVRGMPLRVQIPDGNRSRATSLAAALGIWRSEIDGAPLLGMTPGRVAMCGSSPCYTARWTNPFDEGVFSAGWTAESQGVQWRPMLVTMLHGRTYEDAARLVASATVADARGGARGEFLFMNGGDPARSFLDRTYDGVIAGLESLGFDAGRVPYDSNLTGRTLAGFVVGTTRLTGTIEGNTFAPGALADNLTSFGAHPRNFEASGELQVSIARWVRAGVAGVHGTTAEPLSNSFPSRRLFVDYVEGMTLAEAFLRRMPFAYWQNLVLGDPMAAPYAERPAVRIEPIEAPVRGSTWVRVQADDTQGRGLESLRLFIDGVQVAQTNGSNIERCVDVEAGEVHVLAVAQVAGPASPLNGWSPKGWSSLRVPAVSGPSGCLPSPDAGAPLDSGGSPPPDAGMVKADDAGGAAPPPDDQGGCACRASTTSDPSALMLLAISWWWRRRRSLASVPPGRALGSDR